MKKIILIASLLLFAHTSMWAQDNGQAVIDTTLVYATDDFYTKCSDNGQCYIYSNNYRYYISFDGNEGEPAQPYIGVDIYYDNNLLYKSFSFEMGNESLLAEDFNMFLVPEPVIGVAAPDMPADLYKGRRLPDASPSIQRVVLSTQTNKWSDKLGRLHFKVYLFSFDAEARIVYLCNEVKIKILFENKQASGIKELKQRLTVGEATPFSLSGIKANPRQKKGVVIEKERKYLAR